MNGEIMECKSIILFTTQKIIYTYTGYDYVGNQFFVPPYQQGLKFNYLLIAYDDILVHSSIFELSLYSSDVPYLLCITHFVRVSYVRVCGCI